MISSRKEDLQSHLGLLFRLEFGMRSILREKVRHDSCLVTKLTVPGVYGRGLG